MAAYEGNVSQARKIEFPLVEHDCIEVDGFETERILVAHVKLDSMYNTAGGLFNVILASEVVTHPNDSQAFVAPVVKDYLFALNNEFFESCF